MRRRDFRLLPLAAGVWAAALLCVFVPAVAGWVAAGCAVGACVVIWLARVRGRSRAAMMTGGLAVVLFAAMAAAAITVTLSIQAREQAAASAGRVVEVTATVTSSAAVGQDGRLWFEAQTSSIGLRSEGRPVSVPVRIGVDPADGFDLGAGLRVVGEAAVTDAGERSALVIFATKAEVIHPADGVFGVAADARRAFIERSTRLPEPGAGLLPGLAVGDTRAVSEELNDDMRTTGLSHLTAVSGANCAIVVGAMFWLTSLCGGGRAVRVIVAATSLAGFVVLVTPEPSVIRAAVVAGVAMLTILLGRPRAGAAMLALCVVGILVVDPWLAATPGFALSVAASAALILLAPPLTRGMRRWMPAPIALAIAVPLAAQLACGPIIALFAEQQSLIGVAANLLAAPAAPIATVIGLLACLAAPIPPVADLLAASAWLPAAWIATTATTAADLPIAQILLPAGIGSALLVLGVSTALALVILRPRVEDATSERPLMWNLRRAAAAALIIVLALGGARALLDGPLATASTPEGWSIAACDVGQGDALVVRSEGVVALIDTGPEPEPLARCLRSLGVERIDLLVLTHFDLDHIGGVAAVQGKVGVLLHGPPDGPDDQRVLDALSEGGASSTDAETGMRGKLGASSWRVLWPQRASVAFPKGNDASVVVEFSGGDVPRSLFLGDLSAAPQRMLMRTARLSGGYAVVKVAHHGSADQDPGLYQALRPMIALFSVGADNDYGHPRDETLDLLGATGAHAFRTDRQGRILIRLDDGELRVWTEASVGRPR
ncbi:ComE operon protein 3 [Microbacterium oxydans]|uniref:ComEC/Rec2 family competence protein n=1 Tax=Microbacterium oxydans TaxID=82380 RepID=UPI001D7EE54E|nr:ComEC/Rec2 family competence protein [Microbacterium oxydans]CAH0139408.1 ComE operon protein 3 [Microbacterium oxydans]